MASTTINIRTIQHFMYCPRRYALLEINKDWNENAFVVKADLMHTHVHDGSHDFSDSRKVVRSAVAIYNDLPQYDLYGIADCVEFVKRKDGVPISGLDGTYDVRVVEYKPSAPKDEAFHKTDAIQAFAQKICADYVWKCNSEAYLYYADIRKRIKLPFDTEFAAYDHMLQDLLKQMRTLTDAHTIPKRKRGQKCAGCSLGDVCFPKERTYCIKEIVLSMKEADFP